MKTAFCDTLKNCQFQYISIPQKSLDLIQARRNVFEATGAEVINFKLQG